MKLLLYTVFTVELNPVALDLSVVLIIKTIVLEIVANSRNKRTSHVNCWEIGEICHPSCKNNRRHLHHIKRVNFIVVGYTILRISIEDLVEKLIQILHFEAFDVRSQSLTCQVIESYSPAHAINVFKYVEVKCADICLRFILFRLAGSHV